MPRRDGDLDAFYGSIDPMELLVIHSVTSIWRGDARKSADTGKKQKVSRKARQDFTVHVNLICDADVTLDHELNKLLSHANITKTGPRTYVIHFKKATASATSVRLAVQLFYMRHGLPKQP